MAKQVRDVIVIGAGLSGLSAAKLLHENGLDVIVLEARDRVGGRTLTEHNENVKYVDLGGAYVGPTQNRILRLADEFGIKTFLTNEEQDLIYFTKGKTRRFHGAFPPMGGLLPFLDLNNFFRLMDKMGEEIPMDAPWKAPHAEEWDQQTMQEFINKHVWTKELHTAATQFVTVNVTSEPYECSLLWFLWYVKLCGGTTRINAAENGAQERKFIGGSQQISKCMASKIGKDAVLLERPVCHIRQEKDMVTATDINGGKYSARYIIIATPLTLQNKITYDPPLPSLRNQLIQRVPMGSVIKVFVYYKRPFWREKGFCGSSAIDDEDALVEFTLDDVKADGTYPAIMGFILASKARKYVDLSKEERKQRICRLYAKVFESDEALTPVHYEEKNWLEEQWSGGCYTAMMPPGFLTNYGREIRKPVGRLYFAGTETATQWSGYMDGAVQAGERAAREILHTIGRIEEKDIWQDEPENKNVRARDFESTFLERNLPSVGGFLTSVGFVSLATAAGAAAYFYLKHKK